MHVYGIMSNFSVIYIYMYIVYRYTIYMYYRYVYFYLLWEDMG